MRTVKGLILVFMVIGLVGCGAVAEPEGPEDSEEQWGKTVFFDTAVYNGIIDGEHVALELKNSPQQYDMYSVTPEVMQVLAAAQFRSGKELVVQYRAGASGLALLEDIKQQGEGERLRIAAGTFVGEVSAEHRLVALSCLGQITEYYLDKAVYDSFRAKVSQGQHIVAYFRKSGSTKTIVGFE